MRGASGRWNGREGGAVRRALARLAARAPARVHALVGAGARDRAAELAVDPRIERAESPRSAEVLLVAGRLEPALLKPAARVHDQVAPPRATVLWGAGPDAADGALSRLFPDATPVAPDDDPVPAIVAARDDLLAGRRASEPPVQPDHPPAPWRGLGPWGHGGKGMTGGRPHGRPLAERGEARDGLALDRLPFRVGPFFPAFPPGLALDVVLQGDVLQEVAPAPNPFAAGAPGPLGCRSGAPLAPDVPGTVAEIEMARARSHLRWLAEALRVHGLPALGRRALLTARGLRPGDPRPIRRLAHLLERTRALGWATRGIGTLGPVAVDPAWGPIARAAGVAADARIDDPVYRELGFAPVVQSGGDARARWRQRVAEAVQAVELAGTAGDRRPGSDTVEGPRGPRGPHDPGGPPPSAALAELLAGLEWGDAVTALVSLDLDLEDEARRAAGGGEGRGGDAAGAGGNGDGGAAGRGS